MSVAWCFMELVRMIKVEVVEIAGNLRNPELQRGGVVK